MAMVFLRLWKWWKEVQWGVNCHIVPCCRFEKLCIVNIHIHTYTRACAHICTIVCIHVHVCLHIFVCKRDCVCKLYIIYIFINIHTVHTLY
jgi:hypothetical protein